MSTRISFHDRLKGLRTARGMSLRSLADELKEHGVEVSHNAIQKWEQPKMTGAVRLPSVEVIAALSKIFAVEPAWLVDEIFFRTKKSVKSQRLEAFQDIELLTNDQFDALLAVKKELLKIGINKVKNGS
mgnify:CR=1 FL=1